jgi:hypothetical protein
MTALETSGLPGAGGFLRELETPVLPYTKRHCSSFESVRRELHPGGYRISQVAPALNTRRFVVLSFSVGLSAYPD